MIRVAAPLALLAVVLLLLAAGIVGTGVVLGMQLREAEPPSVAIRDLRESEGVLTLAHQTVSLDELPSRLATVLVMIEDARFYSHHGIDLRSIRFALEVNLQAGRIVYGGSTITQQLARTLFLSPRQTVVRKAIEALLAVGLDYSLSKRRILELYINYAEWGPGVYGIQGAARYHFDKDATVLSTVEQMALLTILPNPRVFTPADFQEHAVIARRHRLIAFHYWAQEHLFRFQTDLERVR